MATFSAFWVFAHAARGGMAPPAPFPWIRQWAQVLVSGIVSVRAMAIRYVVLLSIFDAGVMTMTMNFDEDDDDDDDDSMCTNMTTVS